MFVVGNVADVVALAENFYSVGDDCTTTLALPKTHRIDPKRHHLLTAELFADALLLSRSLIDRVQKNTVLCNQKFAFANVSNAEDVSV